MHYERVPVLQKEGWVAGAGCGAFAPVPRKMVGNFVARDRARRERMVLATKFLINLYPGDPKRRFLMTTSSKFVILALAALTLSGAAWSQGRGDAQFAVQPDGTIVITHQTVPLPSILSDGAKKVLDRNTPSEGPGAPVPTPADIRDMAELRRVYNQNLQPNVDHMRNAFPVDIEETTIDGISVAVITPKGGVPEKNKHRAFLNGPGGGFRTGVRANGLLISIPVAATLGVKVYSILYRQAPEYKFPAGEEDMLKVWNVLTKTYKPENMGMVGCSAGGSLISHVTAMLLLKGQPAPGVLGVYCAGIASVAQGDSSWTSALAITNIPAAVAASTKPQPAGAGTGQGMGYLDGADPKQPDTRSYERRFVDGQVAAHNLPQRYT